MNMKQKLIIDANSIPNVLFLGNGMLKLSDKGIGWKELLEKIKTRTVRDDWDKVSIPMAMQPEVFCGVNVEDIQRKVSEVIPTIEEPHPLLKELLKLPFDAVITTNYTYEIESLLTGKTFTKSAREKAFTALDGNSKVKNNTHICNIVSTPSGKSMPVFHIHGEAWRKHSLVLSYYSYADSVSRLIKYKKELGNKLFEHQEAGLPFECKCWLDYFILGNVWSVGFGLDASEFDVWWAIERKAREVAKRGKLHAFFDGDKNALSSQKLLLDAMEAKCTYYPVDGSFEGFYQKVIKDIKKEMGV